MCGSLNAVRRFLYSRKDFIEVRQRQGDAGVLALHLGDEHHLRISKGLHVIRGASRSSIEMGMNPQLRSRVAL